MKLFRELNLEQRKGLSNLCLDIAKGLLAISIFPIIEIDENLIFQIFKITFAILSGIAFTIISMLILSTRRYGNK